MREGASLLVADIGGTNARFALARMQDGGLHIALPRVFQTADHPRLEDALCVFLAENDHPPLAGAAICAAGPALGTGAEKHIQLTNCPWEVTVHAFAKATGVAAPALMNDFEALALSIPALGPDDRHRIGAAGEAVAGAPIGIVGAGTGLGVSGLIFDGPRAVALAGEGGHVDLAAADAREAAVLLHLQARFGHVSAERVLSGPGLATLYEALADIDGVDAPVLAPAEIAARAQARSCPHASEAVQLFCGWLGAVAGNLALTLGAGGGIYIGGGIVPGWHRTMPGLFDEAGFRARFEAKGRLAPYLAAIPAFIITRDDAALLGLARAAMATA